MDPNNEVAWNNKGSALNNIGRYEEALDWLIFLIINFFSSFTEVIQLNPTFKEAWFNKGYAYYYLGKFEDALN